MADEQAKAPEQELWIRRMVTVEWRVPVSNYPGMTAEEAAEHERNLDIASKLETITLALEVHPSPDFGEVIRIQEKL